MDNFIDWCEQSYEIIQNDCLIFQEKLFANVNIVLCLLWCELVIKRQLNEQQINELIQCVKTVQQEFTGPLRQLRYQAKLSQKNFPNFYQQLLQTEIHSEYLQLQQLWQVIEQWKLPQEQNVDNLMIYFKIISNEN